MVWVNPGDLEDLQDLALFAAIIENGGVNAASRHLSIPKSRLSRHLSALEDRYGVQLLHRSTRRFATTDLGDALYERCLALLDSAQAARQLMSQAQAEPHGVLRVSAPSPLVNFWLAPLLPGFLRDYPSVQLELVGRDRDLDMAADRIDVAIHVRPTPLEDADMLIRHLGVSRQILVAAPSLLARHPPLATPADLESLPLIGLRNPHGPTEWPLTHEDGRDHVVSFQPRLATFELVVLRTAAIEGVGVAVLPAHFCHDAIAGGALTPILPGWRGPLNNIHAAYLSRRGLSRGARAFLDFLVKELPKGDAE